MSSCGMEHRSEHGVFPKRSSPFTSTMPISVSTRFGGRHSRRSWNWTQVLSIERINELYPHRLARLAAPAAASNSRRPVVGHRDRPEYRRLHRRQPPAALAAGRRPAGDAGLPRQPHVPGLRVVRGATRRRDRGGGLRRHAAGAGPWDVRHRQLLRASGHHRDPRPYVRLHCARRRRAHGRHQRTLLACRPRGGSGDHRPYAAVQRRAGDGHRRRSGGLSGHDARIRGGCVGAPGAVPGHVSRLSRSPREPAVPGPGGLRQTVGRHPAAQAAVQREPPGERARRRTSAGRRMDGRRSAPGAGGVVTGPAGRNRPDHHPPAIGGGGGVRNRVGARVPACDGGGRGAPRRIRGAPRPRRPLAASGPATGGRTLDPRLRGGGLRIPGRAPDVAPGRHGRRHSGSGRGFGRRLHPVRFRGPAVSGGVGRRRRRAGVPHPPDRTFRRVAVDHRRARWQVHALGDV